MYNLNQVAITRPKCFVPHLQMSFSMGSPVQEVSPVTGSCGPVDERSANSRWRSIKMDSSESKNTKLGIFPPGPCLPGWKLPPGAEVALLESLKLEFIPSNNASVLYK
ncbi:hypothetical protein AGIG_G18749 [Arapaima gigas]